MMWKDKLREHIAGEQNDHDTYEHIAEEADKEGCCHEAGVLRDIAHEEWTHKKLITELLHEGM